MPNPENEKLRYLALMWGAGLGPAGFHRLVEHFGDTRSVLAADVDTLRLPGFRLTPEQTAMIPALHERLDEYAVELPKLKTENISVLCEWESEYPALFREIRNPPPVICVAGRILPVDDPAIAIVGTRRPSPQGTEMARSLGRAFAELNTTVVSGLAMGCDTEAHTGALEGGGRTIAILGSGVRVIEPRQNLALAREIFSRGAVVSEQPPSAVANTGTFIARNRLQSALSRAVLVVESRAQGGAMATAKAAEGQGRRLYAVRPQEYSETTRGNKQLLSEGAHPVDGPESAPEIRIQLVDHIGRMAEDGPPSAPQRSLFDT